MARQDRRDPERERFWRAAVAGWKKSGQTVRAYCRGRGLGQASFFAWRRELDKRDRAAARPAPTFVPVTVVPASGLEVVLPSGMIIRVPAGADAAAVAKLVAALGPASC